MNLDELRKLAGMPQTEWANSPATTAHPDPEEVQAPEADVNQSLRKYLNAEPQPVKVVEGEDKTFEDHEVEDMMAKFKEYLSEDEAVEEQAQEEVVEQADETVEEAKVGTPGSLDKVEAQIQKLKDMAKKAKDDGDPQKANQIQSSDEMTELLRKQKKLKNESIEETDESVDETVENESIQDLKKLAGIKQVEAGPSYPGEYDYMDPKYMNQDGSSKVESGAVAKIMAKHPQDVAKMKATGDLDAGSELMMDLMDYYSDEMPYGTMKARDGDPVEWIMNKLDDMNMLESQIAEEPNEDNAFNSAAANAKKAGKSEFTFNGKKYKVKMDDKTADALTDSVEPKVESQDIADIKKLAGIGETTTDQTMSAEITALKKLAGI